MRKVLFNPFIGDIWIKQSQFVLDMKIVSVIVFNAFMYYRRQPIWQFQNVAGFYGNYAMIVTQIQTMFIALVNGAVAGLGDVVAEGDLEKIRKIFKVYDFTYYLIASFVGLSFYVLFNPFIGDIWIKQSQFVLDMKIVSVIVFNAFMCFI